MERSFILNLSCSDTIGIVNAVSGWLVQRQFNILESAQFGDAETGLFALRICFQAESDHRSTELEREFDILQGRENGYQIEALKNKPNMVGAEAGSFRVR